MKVVGKRFAVVLVIVAGTVTLGAAPGVAQSSGSLTLFGITYNFTGIDVQGTDFAGSDPNYTGCGGMGLGYYQGATLADDRLYICDETGPAENAAMLIGADATTYEFDADATLDYITITASGNYDPVALDWISDSGTENVRVLLSDSEGSQNRIVALDRAGYDGMGVQYGNWTTVTDNDSTTGFVRITASCVDNPLSPTKMYVGGIKNPGVRHFAYQVFDLTTASFASAGAIYLEQMGTPAESSGVWSDREFRGLGADGTYFYAAVWQPGDGLWLYRYSSLPTPGGTDSTHPGPAPDSAQLDGAGGLAYPASNRYDRTGLTCGRVFDNGYASAPVIYVLCEYYLYTLVPELPEPPEPEGDSAGVGAGWQDYR